MKIQLIKEEDHTGVWYYIKDETGLVPGTMNTDLEVVERMYETMKARLNDVKMVTILREDGTD